MASPRQPLISFHPTAEQVETLKQLLGKDWRTTVAEDLHRQLGAFIKERQEEADIKEATVGGQRLLEICEKHGKKPEDFLPKGLK